MDQLQKISELDRKQRNFVFYGSVKSYNKDDRTAIIAMDNGLDSEPLPVQNRYWVEVGEPVIIISPLSTPAVGHVFFYKHDPKLDDFEKRILALEQCCKTCCDK